MNDPKLPGADINRQRMMYFLWGVLSVWIVLLAVGASLYAPAPGDRDHATVDWRRGLMVLVFVGGFLGGWIWLAARRKRS